MKILKQTMMVLLNLIAAAAFAQPLYINEIMPRNITYLSDEEGQYPDWLEIYNAGVKPLDLSAYALSDDRQNLGKWSFPAVALQPDSFRLVFATGTDSTYFGLHYESVCDWGDSFRYVIGSQDVPANWREMNFDDKAWNKGPSGFGYGDGDDATDVSPANAFDPKPISVFVRRKFLVEHPSRVTNLLLHIDYDDAFVAYLNGVEIARANIGQMGNPPAYDHTAAGYHEALMYQNQEPQRFVVGNFKEILLDGENVLTIQVHNSDAFSSDMTLIPFLTLEMDYIPSQTRGPSPYLDLPSTDALYANFKLNAGGETIYLSDSLGFIMDSIRFGVVPGDISFGRQPDGAASWLYFSEPTPGAPNITPGFTASAPEVKFSSGGGFYDTSFLVELSTDGTGEIRFTLDGSQPTVNSYLYVQPIFIDSIMVVRARCFGAGLLPGIITTHSYFIKLNFSLPVVALSTTPANFFDYHTGIYVFGPNADSLNYPYWGSNFWEDWERPVHVEFFETDRQQGFSLDAGVKIFGSWSRLFPQKSLVVFARERYGTAEIAYPLFQQRNNQVYRSFILRNSGQDWGHTFFRDGLMSKLVQNTDLDYMDYRPVLVFLNGKFWGIHNLREKMDEDFLAANRDVDPNNIDFIERDSTMITGTVDAYRALLDYVDAHDMSDSTHYSYVQTVMDVHNFMDYIIACMFYANPDWPWNNVRCWRERNAGGRFKWMIYDNDYGFHGGHLGEWSNMFDEIGAQQNGATLLFFKLLENPTFRREFINRNADHLNVTFHPQRTVSMIDSFQMRLGAEMPRHIQRWQYSFVGPWWLGKSIDSMDEWYASVDVLRQFAQLRGNYVREQIMQEFGIVDGGTLTIHLKISPENAGQIQINSQIIQKYPWQGIYFKEVSVDLRAIVRAGYRFKRWEGIGLDSAKPVLQIFAQNNQLIEAVFEADSTDSVVFNEINYRSAADFNSEDWIELFNSGGFDVNAGGWKFLDDDDSHTPFVLPANTIIKAHDYLVLCRDRTAFKQLFPLVQNCLGDFSFGLSSNGELIRLYDQNGIIVDSLRYDVVYPWPREANGSGRTLELKNPLLDNSLGQNWEASAHIGGTPNVINSVLTTLKEQFVGLPQQFALKQNYPNPFNSQTVISFDLPVAGKTILIVYNLLGEKVSVLFEGNCIAGTYQFTWNGKNDQGSVLGSGVYFYYLQTRNFNKCRKMVLLR